MLKRQNLKMVVRIGEHALAGSLSARGSPSRNYLIFDREQHAKWVQ